MKTRPKSLICCAMAAALVALAPGTGAFAARKDPTKLPLARIKDLHYGDVLFYFYQDESFESLTRLLAYEQWQRLPNHGPESQLLLGGLYLQLGLNNEAGRRFETLLTPEIPAGVRNRAWFYLGKVWYARGYYDKSEQALRQVQGKLPAELEAEKHHLLANVLLHQQRFDDAIQVLNGWSGLPSWVAYAKFNLGVALVRKGSIDEADPFLTSVGTLDSARSELLSLKDRANLALGFAYLQAEQPAKALPALKRVRLDGPFSNKALLGAGWAQAQLGDFRGALTPWLELHDRNLLDAAVQESYLAVPYAFGKLDAHAQSAEYYEAAIRSFDEENARLDDALGKLQAGRMLDEVLTQEANEGAYGWFWQLKKLPDAPQSRYLYTLLAGHDFQEGLKNYRDLAYLDRTLDRWSGSLGAFDYMIDARERAHAERLPRADALLASGAVDQLRGRRDSLAASLDQVQAGRDYAALGTAEERAQWARISKLEQQIAARGSDPETAAARDKLRLVKGVLQWRLDASFKERMWQQRRTVRDLDGALRETQNRWVHVERARGSVPMDTGQFASRLAVLATRLEALKGKLATARDAQNDFLEQLAAREFESQKERLASYQIQARFALASIYDRAASGAGPQTAPAPAPEARAAEEGVAEPRK